MFLTVERLGKDYGRARGSQAKALDDVSVGVEAGGMLALVGPSGSGKTTLLRCIAGLETPDTGTIRIGGTLAYGSAERVLVPTERRDLGLIFQSYALWPHMTVADNVAYPLRRRRMPEAQQRERIARYLALVGCEAFGARYPHELSGGQQQRIALARALVYEPALVLFDEPLSNLDTALRMHLRAQIREIQRSVGFTGVYVTHDQQEAFYVGDRVAVLHHGRLAQCDTPDAIYRRPASAQVAHFVGAENRCDGAVCGVAFEAGALGSFSLAEGMRVSEGPATLMVRPEALTLQPHAGGAPAARVTDCVLVGANWEYLVALDDGARWRAVVPVRHAPLAIGTAVSLQAAPEDLFVYPREAAH